MTNKEWDKKHSLDIITVKADIHPDGDVYIKTKKGMKLIGCLGYSTFRNVPDTYYLKAKKIYLK